MSNANVIEMLKKDFDEMPSSVRNEIEQRLQEDGLVDGEKLSDETKNYFDELIKRKSLPELEIMIKNVLEDSGKLSRLTVEGIERFKNMTNDLNLCFHNAEANRQSIAIYNACSEFIRDYNIMDLEHHSCLESVLKEESDE